MPNTENGIAGLALNAGQWRQRGGTKNALVNICEEAQLLRDPEERSSSRTSSFGWRKLYATEGTTNRFSDEGFGQTINGTATIMLDPIYMETVNTTDGSDTRFSWQVSALRRGYEQYRLEEWENG